MSIESSQSKKVTQPPMPLPVASKKNETIYERLAGQELQTAIIQAVMQAHNASVEVQIQRDLEYARDLEKIKQEHAEMMKLLEMLLSDKHSDKIEKINI